MFFFLLQDSKYKTNTTDGHWTETEVSQKVKRVESNYVKVFWKVANNVRQPIKRVHLHVWDLEIFFDIILKLKGPCHLY